MALSNRNTKRPAKTTYHEPQPSTWKDSSSSTTRDLAADKSPGEAGTTTTTPAAQQPALRSMNMNTYQSQPARQTPRLQNTQKTGLGNGLGGWGMGLPSSGGFGAGGSLGGAPGLGARPGQLSGFAQVMGGGGGQGPIDMSDFPSLSGGPRPNQATVPTTAGSWNSNAIRQPSGQQQSQQPPQQQQRAPSTAPSQQSLDQFEGQRSQQPPIDRASGGGDEFPPLGGQVNGDIISNTGLNSGFGSPDSTLPRQNGQQTQLPIREPQHPFHQTPQAPMGSGQPPAQAQQLPPAQNGQPPSSTVKKYADMTEHEKYGLQGLLAAFEARRQAEQGGPVDDTLPAAMRNAVFMGQDLSSLGLDLDSPDPLYPTFTPFPAATSSSQFDFHDRHTVPDFTLPSAYTVTNVPPLSNRMSAFSDETLFSIFYQNPRDVVQELAAMELTARDWRWHKILRQWLQKDTRESNGSSSLPIVDLANGAPVGAQPVRVGDRTERGVYVFFDAMNWRRERREFILDYEQLDHRHGSAMPNGVPGGAVGPALGAGGPPGVGGAGITPGGGVGSQQPSVGGGGGGVGGSSQIPSA